MGTKTYTASEQIYISSEGRMVYPGEKFTVTDKVKPGSTWLDEDGNPLPETEADEAKADPLDHDGDGKRGGSLPGDASTAARGARSRQTGS